jgi:hypothetical protein
MENTSGQVNSCLQPAVAEFKLPQVLEATLTGGGIYIHPSRRTHHTVCQVLLHIHAHTLTAGYARRSLKEQAARACAALASEGLSSYRYTLRQVLLWHWQQSLPAWNPSGGQKGHPVNGQTMLPLGRHGVGPCPPAVCMATSFTS